MRHLPAVQPRLRTRVVRRAGLGAMLALLAALTAAAMPAPSAVMPPARAIAEASPDAREAARRLQRAGVAAPQALTVLREVFDGAPRELYAALLAAQYPRPELAAALKSLDLLDARAFDRVLADYGETPEVRAPLLLRLYPGFDFARLLQQLQSTRTLTQDNYAAAMAALAPPLAEIAAIAARDHRARRFPAGSGRFFPEPQDAHALIRASHPGARHAAIWAALLAAGYEPALLFERLPVGERARDGRPLDAIAGCIAQAFPGAAPAGNPTLVLPAGVASTAQTECYRRFGGALRAERVPRDAAAAVLHLVPQCIPASDPQCARQRDELVRAWLASAGYPADPS
jgi:hypothetical protein